MIRHVKAADVRASGRVTETDIADGRGRSRIRGDSWECIGWTRGGARIEVRRNGAACLYRVSGYAPSGSDLSLAVQS